MAEATHTAEAMYGLRQPIGRGGGRLIALYLQIDDAETVDTGLDFVYAAVTCPVEDFAADTPFSCPTSVATTGTLTMSVGAWDDAATDAGSNHYMIVVGQLR